MLSIWFYTFDKLFLHCYDLTTQDFQLLWWFGLCNGGVGNPNSVPFASQVAYNWSILKFHIFLVQSLFNQFKPNPMASRIPYHPQQAAVGRLAPNTRQRLPAYTSRKPLGRTGRTAVEGNPIPRENRLCNFGAPHGSEVKQRFPWMILRSWWTFILYIYICVCVLYI